MQYNNPIIVQDFSDPDAIRVGNDFFMIASSFNYVPGVPILHSKNLVDWQVINYVYDEIPFSRFNKVVHGCGAWAPAIRYHDGWFYAIIPFPDEGIYVSKTKNPFGKWSELWCLIPGKGIEDPCPIWIDDKAYLVVGFVKSRIGFNSCLGLYEVSVDLKEKISDTYTIIYDGHNDNPTIEGPKFNEHNGYYYIMAPAGSVKTGWQVCLRSKNIYGPYETKIVLLQNDSKINGPHQGALLDIDDNDHYAFIHFTDQNAYGRIVCLEPVEWHNDWPICGLCKDPLLGGSPVLSHDYLINKDVDHNDKNYLNHQNVLSDDFKEKLNMHWQTPANRKNDWFYVNNGLYYKGYNSNEPLHLYAAALSMKINSYAFNVNTLVSEAKSDVGLFVMGMEYAYICLNNKMVKIIKGSFDGNEEVIYKEPYFEEKISFNLHFEAEKYYFGYNDNMLKQFEFVATKGKWVGSRIGIYSRNGNTSKFEFFNVEEVKKWRNW